MKGIAGSLVVLVNWLGAWAVSFTFNFLMNWSSSGKNFFPVLPQNLHIVSELTYCTYQSSFRHFLCLFWILCDDHLIRVKVRPGNEGKDTRRNPGMHQLIDNNTTVDQMNMHLEKIFDRSRRVWHNLFLSWFQ